MCQGAGTDDKTLIRVIVTRCEVDMKQIKEEFQRRYGQSLEAFVRVRYFTFISAASLFFHQLSPLLHKKFKTKGCCRLK
jgi:hypothetical protein